jgi:hypothetical protein
LEDSDHKVEINKAWETIKETIKICIKESICFYELKKHNPWFEEGHSKSLDQRKEVEMQRLQDPSEINRNNLNNVRREVRRHFRSKRKEYLKDKFDELATNHKNNNTQDLYRRINEFKKGYQPRSKLVKEEKSDLLAVPQHFRYVKELHFQLLNVNVVSNVRSEVFMAVTMKNGVFWDVTPCDFCKN